MIRRWLILALLGLLTLGSALDLYFNRVDFLTDFARALDGHLVDPAEPGQP